jgi:hypothetical protein
MYDIGTEEEAGFILYWYLHVAAKSGYYDQPEAPEGWKRLGSGCYRIAYLSPSGVVYKVQGRYEANDDRWQSNKTETANLRKNALKKFPKGCRLPRWSEFYFGTKTVVAMEKFDKLLNQLSYGERDSVRALKQEMLRVVTDLLDTHDANLAYDVTTKEVVIIDWGG